MVLTLQKTVPVQKTIPVPCFWKKQGFYYGLIDENNFYQILTLDNYHSLTNSHPSDFSIVKTYFDESAEVITEEQFWSMYQEARLATELEPREKSFTETLSNVIQLKEV